MEPIAAYWDAAAADFDRQPDHGLLDEEVRAAWSTRLRAWLPAAPAAVLDLGCGTGTLSCLLAGQGHRPTAVDLSPAMAERARAKLVAAGAPVRVLVGDAGDPPVAPGSFDVVLARHLLWTFPDPSAALRRWTTLLRPGGRLVLVEGRWDVPGGSHPYAERAGAMPWLGGVRAGVLSAVLAPLVARVRVEPLPDPRLWGRPVHDERYAVIAHL